MIMVFQDTVKRNWLAMAAKEVVTIRVEIEIQLN